LTAYEGEDLYEDVKAFKDAYDSSLLRLMAQHSIGTEFEVYTSFVLGYDSGGTNKDYTFAQDLAVQVDISFLSFWTITHGLIVERSSICVSQPCFHTNRIFR
jgi:hypothetical protein